MIWRFPHNPTAYDDDWEDQPGQGPFYQWLLGVAVPIGGLYSGLQSIFTEKFESFGQFPMTLHGLNAIAAGVAVVSAAVFMHCHYFWGNIYSQVWFAVLGKIIAACGFISGIGVVLVRNGVLGIQ